MTEQKIRVRFAPSPTGKLHIGGARTALFNWAFARATGGAFILRIEDTDPERSTQENVEVILNALKWLELDWDEGPLTGGAHGPYFQTQRADSYAEALKHLQEKDAVYPCFCTKEELDAKRAQAEAQGGGYSGYDRSCRSISPEEARRRIEAGEEHVWRLKVPDHHGAIEFDDLVYGRMSFPEDAIDDMIVVRSDGSPTYNFAVVCDDANMEITHVIRGDDHLSNTPKQVLIYEALGCALPQFAHLSMILGPDGKKLSKRHGATSVEEYRDRGYLPDALVNFLALLGWSLDGETTVISREELCRTFSLERVTKKDAVFDETKLDWLNGLYIREMGAPAWVESARPFLAQAVVRGQSAAPGVHIVPAPTSPAPAEPAPSPQDESAPAHTPAPTSPAQDDQSLSEALAFVEAQRTWFERVYPLVSERLEHFDQIPDKLAYLFWGSNCCLDEKSVQKILQKERAEEALRACLDILASPENPWEASVLEEKCRALSEPLDMKLRNLLQPLRVAVCGNMVSPPLFESIELMEREQVIARIKGVMEAVYGAGA